MLGGHGDTMVPLTRYSTVAGIPVPDLVKMGWTTQAKIDAIVRRAPPMAAARSSSCWRRGSAFYAPAASAIAMAESLPEGQEARAALRRLSDRPYGIKDMYVGVPVVIGAGGVEKIVEIELNATEKAAFDKSCARCGADRGLKKLIG